MWGNCKFERGVRAAKPMNRDLTEGNEGNEGMRRRDHQVKQKGKIVDGKIIGRIAA
jgi:hypothetical protein